MILNRWCVFDTEILFAFRKFAISAGRVVKFRLFILLLAGLISPVAFAGTVKRWSDDFGGKSNVPQGSSAFMMREYEWRPFSDLKSYISVFDWPNNYYRAGELPFPETTFLAISLNSSRHPDSCDPWFILADDSIKDYCRVVGFFMDNRLSPFDFRTFEILTSEWVLDCSKESNAAESLPE